jgi:hypothetical protein
MLAQLSLKPFRFCLLLTATLSYLNSERSWSADIPISLWDSGPDFPNLTINVGDTITWMKADPSLYGWLCQGYFGEWSLCAATQSDKVSLSFNTAGTFVYQTFYAACSSNIVSAEQTAVGTITVKAWTNGPPAITLNSPIEGFYYDPGAPVPLLASVTNQPEVLAVDFYADSDWLGCVFTSPYQLTRSIPPGAHALTAQVTDMTGNVATSAPVNITVFPSFALFLFDLKRLTDGAMLFHYACPTDTSHYTVLVYDKLGGRPRGGVNANFFGSGTALDTRATNHAVRFYQMSHVP